MKALLSTAAIAALSILASTASAGVKMIPEKYQFDDQLPQVERFSRYSIDGWNAIDKRSLIVRTSPSTSYLLILQRDLPSLRFNDAIGLSSTGSQVHARFDTVRVFDRHFTSIPVAISKIYKLKGRDQRKQVKAQIREG